MRHEVQTHGDYMYLDRICTNGSIVAQCDGCSAQFCESFPEQTRQPFHGTCSSSATRTRRDQRYAEQGAGSRDRDAVGLLHDFFTARHARHGSWSRWNDRWVPVTTRRPTGNPISRPDSVDNGSAATIVETVGRVVEIFSTLGIKTRPVGCILDIAEVSSQL
jgi:hypothetical protein